MIDVDLLFNLLIVVVFIGLVFWGGVAIYSKLSESVKNLEKAIKKVYSLAVLLPKNGDTGEPVHQPVIKSASPLAFDDGVIMCTTLEDKEKVMKRVENNLCFIDHLWQPQELLQLLSLVKSYIAPSGEFHRVLDYYFIRYIESLVMHLNLLNGYYIDSEGNISEIEKKERKTVIEELNHSYYLAKSFVDESVESYKGKDENQDLPDIDLPTSSVRDKDNNSREKSENNPLKYIEVDKIPKSKDDVSIDANDRLLHDLQNAEKENTSESQNQL